MKGPNDAANERGSAGNRAIRPYCSVGPRPTMTRMSSGDLILVLGAVSAVIGLAIVAGKIAARLMYAASERGKPGGDR